MRVALEPEYQFWSNWNANIASDLKQVTPALSSITTELLAAYEYNSAMAERLKVSQDQFCRAAVVKDNVGDALNVPMRSHTNGGYWKGVIEGRIDRDEAIHSSAQQHLTILFDQIRLAPMMSREIEVSRLHQVITDSNYDLIVVGFGEIGHQNTNAQSLLIAQRPRKQTRLIVELFGRSLDPVTSSLRNATARNVVQNYRNCGGMYAEMFGHFFQTHSMLLRSHAPHLLVANIISPFGLAVNRFVERHGLFRTRRSGVLQAALFLAGPPERAVKQAKPTAP